MDLYQAATDIVKTLQESGHSAFFVGGCVRDEWLGLGVNDIDIATSASVEQIQKLFEKTIPVGAKFGILVVVHHGFNFEVATFRKDIGYQDGRHPTSIDSASIQEDAARRDFTINGLFFDPLKKELFDYVEGQADLQAKVLRAIGDPTLRFKEDHLRMIRACRYCAVLDFRLDSKTLEAIIDMAPKVHEGVSIERIYQELEKMHKNQALGKGLAKMLEFKLLKPLFPQLIHEDEPSIYKRILKIQKLKGDIPLILALMILFQVHSKDALEQLTLFFKTSKEAFKTGELLLKCRQHMHLSNFELAAFFSAPSSQACIEVQSLDETHPAQFKEKMEKLKIFLKPVIEKIIQKKPVLPACIFLDLGVPKGPRIKELIELAMTYFAQDPTLTEKQLIEKLKKDL